MTIAALQLEKRMMMNKKKPDKYQTICSMVTVVGAVIIFYGPR
jgi:drug/metabolite transporter superfamily protein YnfA